MQVCYNPLPLPKKAYRPKQANYLGRTWGKILVTLVLVIWLFYKRSKNMKRKYIKREPLKFYLTGNFS